MYLCHHENGCDLEDPLELEADAVPLELVTRIWSSHLAVF